MYDHCLGFDFLQLIHSLLVSRLDSSICGNLWSIVWIMCLSWPVLYPCASNCLILLLTASLCHRWAMGSWTLWSVHPVSHQLMPITWPSLPSWSTIPTWLAQIHWLQSHNLTISCTLPDNVLGSLASFGINKPMPSTEVRYDFCP